MSEERFVQRQRLIQLGYALHERTARRGPGVTSWWMFRVEWAPLMTSPQWAACATYWLRPFSDRRWAKRDPIDSHVSAIWY